MGTKEHGRNASASLGFWARFSFREECSAYVRNACIERFEVGALVEVEEEYPKAVEQVSEVWERLVAKRREAGEAE